MHPHSTLAEITRVCRAAARVVYWSFAAIMIMSGATAALALVACFVFPFLPLLMFFPLASAFGAAARGPRRTPELAARVRKLAPRATLLPARVRS